MMLDNVPVSVHHRGRDGIQTAICMHGFHVGFMGSYFGSNYEKYFINNHLHFKVIYHKDVKTNAEHIVGFEVIPYSVNHEYLLPWEEGKSLITCNSRTKQIDLASSIPQNLAEDKKVIFTYDDTFQEADATQALTLMSVLSLYRGASDTALIGT
ncbi:transmembrane 9 superfamily member 7-like isoform X2 [Amborella trichopoda]|uniref:transmembrane 9 superfamily member 7-like isoform X2 n=1 Tax=Amborella trichopoda TaxID=13333 RepID=UPI0009BDC788|nr:transmembrane 9 superfamily member 7-like isoform X2 [Amborella trichopoda]|eukprot:XP_020529933.1 transmembrane 9 superfamily member 7-like isoform X2 [Amborella trichopoda]